MSIQILPDAELRIMQTIWEGETPISTVELQRKLEEERPWNLSALQTQLGRLVKKGFLQTELEGRSRCYSPLVSEQEYLQQDSRHYLKKWKGGSITDFVATLYDGKTIGKKDLEELQLLIERINRE